LGKKEGIVIPANCSSFCRRTFRYEVTLAPTIISDFGDFFRYLDIRDIRAENTSAGFFGCGFSAERSFSF